MMRAIVIGSPGAGKSTFTKELSTIKRVPLYHLDMLYYQENGQIVPREVFEEKLRQILWKREWIVDGNYQRTLEWRLSMCNTVFFLDYAVRTCLAGAKERIGNKRDDLPWIEEKLSEEIRSKIMKFRDENTPKIYALLEKYKDGREVIVFKTRSEARYYLDKLKEQVKFGR